MLMTAALALALGAAVVVQAVTGSGFGVIAAPAMVLADPRLVPGPLLVLTVVVMGGEMWRGRRHLDLRAMAWPLVGYLVGALLALALVPYVRGRWTALAVAVVLLVAVAFACLGWRPRPSPVVLVLGGVASGVAGLWAGLPGPPVVIVYREPRAERLRANLAAYFAVTSLGSLGLLAAAGHLRAADAVAALWWTPIVAGAALVAGLVVRRVDERWMRPLTLGVSLCGGLALLARAAV